MWGINLCCCGIFLQLCVHGWSWVKIATTCSNNCPTCPPTPTHLPCQFPWTSTCQSALIVPLLVHLPSPFPHLSTCPLHIGPWLSQLDYGRQLWHRASNRMNRCYMVTSSLPLLWNLSPITKGETVTYTSFPCSDTICSYWINGYGKISSCN